MTDDIRNPPPVPDSPEVLAAEHALRLLSPEEARAAEARIAADPAFRAAHARWAEDLAGLAAEVPAVTPPPAVFRGIEARLFPEQRQGLIRRLGIIPALLGGLVAALLLLAVTELGWLRQPGGPALVAEIAATDQSLVLAAAWDPGTGTLRIDRQAGGPATGRVLELWLIAGEAAPVSLGLLADGETTTLQPAPELVAVLAGATLAVSDEPPGGSPLPGPSGAVLAAGVLSAG